jgi:hypothetical protein
MDLEKKPSLRELQGRELKGFSFDKNNYYL